MPYLSKQTFIQQSCFRCNIGIFVAPCINFIFFSILYFYLNHRRNSKLLIYLNTPFKQSIFLFLFIFLSLLTSLFKFSLFSLFAYLHVILYYLKNMTITILYCIEWSCLTFHFIIASIFQFPIFSRTDFITLFYIRRLYAAFTIVGMCPNQLTLHLNSWYSYVGTYRTYLSITLILGSKW